MSWQIRAEDLPTIARGAAALGSGGGGDPYIGALLAAQALTAHGPVEVIGLSELPDDASTAMVAMLGAPTVMVEKVPGFDEVTTPVAALTESTGTPISHIFCAEIGGVNSMVPIAAAALLGLPLIDADGMGRAFPELQMIVPTLYGVPASPLSFADEKGNVGVVNTITGKWAERIVRAACVEMGSSIMICGFTMAGTVAREALVGDTLSLCRRLGEAMEQARVDKADPVDRVVQMLGGREIFAGKIVDVQRATMAGFAQGSARLEGDQGTLRLVFQNENGMATLNGEVLVTVPDLIMVLDHESAEPITTETLRYGQRVRVIAAPSDIRWHSTAGLALAGPASFGYPEASRRFDGSLDLSSQEAS